MKKVCISLLGLFLIKSATGQSDPIQIEVSKSENMNSYRVSIFNNQDSILCFLTCRILKPRDYRLDTTLILSPIKLDSEKRYHYSPEVIDQSISCFPAYAAIAILPYQTKSFLFNILNQSEEKILSVTYFYLKKLDSETFEKEIRSTPQWYLKYNRKEIETLFR